MSKYLILIVFLFSCFCTTNAQMSDDGPASQPADFVIHGYLKFLEQLSYSALSTQPVTEQLLHNRINMAYLPGSRFRFRLEVRNRLYFGELARDYPGFSDLVTANTGLVNLSKNWINERGVLLNSIIDRASAEYLNEKWDITLGRQRINWGINTVWTPNDLFNTFNYFDFDYEERPGTDAARIKYEISSRASIEADFAPGGRQGEQTGAVLLHYNRWTYDFQLFTGVYHTDHTAGLGWAGNLGSAGFKGEATWFSPYGIYTDPSALIASISLDYGFRNGLYVLVSGLYNSIGNDTSVNILRLQAESLSAKNLFPFRYTGFVQCSYPVSPLIKMSLGTMYSPSGNSLILLPDITWSVSNNWSLDLIAQVFASEQNTGYGTLGSSFYGRVKWGF